jgi:type VI protein secretion system component Hcp
MSTVNIFLKIKLTKGGVVKGISNIPGHIDEMFLETIRWGEENSGVGGKGGKGGNVIVRNFEFTKKMCPGSIQLLLACASFDVVEEAVISCRSSNSAEKVDFLKWTLGDGVVRQYEMSATASESVIPLEHVAISFRTLAVEFKPRNASDGTLAAALTARLDLGANTANS